VGLKVVGGAKPAGLPDLGPGVEIKITNAALEGKGKAELFVHRGEEKYLACVLEESKGIFQTHLEYVFSNEDPVPVTFSVRGPKDATVYLTGFGFEQPEEDSSFDEEMFEGSSDEEGSELESSDESEKEEGSVLGIREIPSDEEKGPKHAVKAVQKKSLDKIDESEDDKKGQAKGAQHKQEKAPTGDFKCAPCQKAFPTLRALDQHNLGKHKPQGVQVKPEGNGAQAHKITEKQDKLPETPKKIEKKPQPQTPQPVSQVKIQPKSTPAPKVEDKKRKPSASQGQVSKKVKPNEAK